MREIPFERVDAFTDTPFAGNPAGVIPDAQEIGEEWYLPIAREMAASETAFVLPPTTGGADLRIRWFTPTVEVPLCGHATVAALHTLATQGAFGLRESDGPKTLRLQCESGILPVTVDRDGDGTTWITLGLPIPRMERFQAAIAAVADAIGLAPSEFDLALPPEKSAYYAVLPIRTREALFAIRPNEAALSKLCREWDVIAMIFFTRETVEGGSDVHLRFFGPGAGILEDPVTGSAHGPLGSYLFRHGVVHGESPIAYRAEQGDAMGRPGRVAVSVEHSGGRPTGIAIRGRAVTVLRGTLRLP